MHHFGDRRGCNAGLARQGLDAFGDAVRWIGGAIVNLADEDAAVAAHPYDVREGPACVHSEN